MSYWMKESKDKNHKKVLNKNEKSEVCIIGGGLTGLSVRILFG